MKPFAEFQMRARLKELEIRWPEGYGLFAATSLMLIKLDTQEILASFSIPCDGGDPGFHEENGKEYLDMSDFVAGAGRVADGGYTIEEPESI